MGNAESSPPNAEELQWKGDDASDMAGLKKWQDPYDPRDHRSVNHHHSENQYHAADEERDNHDDQLVFPPRGITSPRNNASEVVVETRSGAYTEDTSVLGAYASEKGEEEEEAISLMDASAAVFHYMEHDGDEEEQEMSISERSAAVFEYLEEEAKKGNKEPVVEFLETASMVSAVLLEDGDSVSLASAAVFRFLEQAQTSDDRSIPSRARNYSQDDQSNNDVFKLLDEAKSIGDAKSISEYSSHVFRLLDHVKSTEGSEVAKQTTNIFRQLEEVASLRSKASSPNLNVVSPTSHLTALHDNRQMPLRIVEEEESVAYSAVTGLDDFTEADNYQLKNEFEGQDIDLEFVEHYDDFFNEFIAAHPEFVVYSPELVHQLRISKLQKLLHHIDGYEKAKEREWTKLKIEKEQMELGYALQLREASSKKAARQITLQSDLTTLNQSTKEIETKLTWEFVEASEKRCKRQHQFRREMWKQKPLTHPHQVKALIPTDDDGKALRLALFSSVEDDQQSLRQYQVDSAFMKAELELLTKKMRYQHGLAKKYAWVESLLLKLDDISMEQLRTNYVKNASTDVTSS